MPILSMYMKRYHVQTLNLGTLYINLLPVTYRPCGEEDEQGGRHRICRHSSSRVVYAWALDGQPRVLPPGTLCFLL